ncbi:MAG: AAA family ATPase [Myxococcota bacterium]
MTTKELRGRKRDRTKAQAKAKPGVSWELVERVLQCSAFRVIFLFGPPGIGKTWCAMHQHGNPNGVLAVTLTEDTPAMELRGHYVQNEQGMVWQDGNFVRALRRGATLVVNEASHAAEDVRTFLYPVLESPETAEMTLPTGEVIKPAPGFRCVLTDNLSPEELPEALRSRIQARLHIRKPHPAALARLSPDLRAAAEVGFDLEEERRISLREWLALEEARPLLGLQDAAVAVFGDERGPQLLDALALGEAAD